jgi:hypothetical protein
MPRTRAISGPPEPPQPARPTVASATADHARIRGDDEDDDGNLPRVLRITGRLSGTMFASTCLGFCDGMRP